MEMSNWTSHAAHGLPVVLTKLKTLDTSCYTEQSVVSGVPGQMSRGIPSDHQIEGLLINPIEVGQPIRVLRTKRNGIESVGIFQTSHVCEIIDDEIHTANSIYRASECMTPIMVMLQTIDDSSSIECRLAKFRHHGGGVSADIYVNIPAPTDHIKVDMVVDSSGLVVHNTQHEK